MLMIDKPVSIGEERETLYGTLTLPEGDGPCDAFLVWSGAGPVDRDGNAGAALNSNCLKLLCHALGAAGYACLRADKRGNGESAPALVDEAKFLFDDIVDDVVAWARVLRDESRVARLFLIGHSEGGLAVTLAAERIEAAGLILIGATGLPAAKIIRRQLSAPEIAIPPDLLREILEIMTALEAGQTVRDVSEELEAQFRPAVQPYLISWFAHDPAAALAGLSLPALVIQGGRDLQVSMEDAECLAAARPDIDLVRITEMNHVLKDAPADTRENFETYRKPLLPLSAGLVPAILKFAGGL